ncbi:MAG: helix-turn-helix domain-containing protein [Solirubrobacteraceae bacterium]
MRPLPRGPHRLAREEVLASQHGRMVDAIAEVVALRGYNAATVADVVERAGVSRKTFYEHFRDKEDCFLAAYETGVEILMATMRAAGDDHRSRIGAYLATLAAEPAFARTFVIEVGAAGPRALERRQAVHEAFAALTGTAPEALACVGAANELVAREIAHDRTASLPGLEDLIVSIYDRLL